MQNERLTVIFFVCLHGAHVLMFDVWLYKTRPIAVALESIFISQEWENTFLVSSTPPILFINQHLSKPFFINMNWEEKKVKDHTQYTVHCSKTLGQKCTFFLKIRTQFHTYLFLDDSAELLITHRISDRRHCMPQMVLTTWHLSTFFNHRAVCKGTHVHFLFTVRLRRTGKGTEKTLLALHPQQQAHCPIHFELPLGICQLTHALLLPAMRRQNIRATWEGSWHGKPLMWTEGV